MVSIGFESKNKKLIPKKKNFNKKLFLFENYTTLPRHHILDSDVTVAISP